MTTLPSAVMPRPARPNVHTDCCIRKVYKVNCKNLSTYWNVFVLSVLDKVHHLKEYDMRVPAFSLIVASVLLAAPAFAQSSSVTTSSERASNLPPDTMGTLDTQQKLK